MEVIQSNNKDINDNDIQNTNSEKQNDEATDVISAKKKQFRVQIRNSKIRSILSEKRIKISSGQFGGLSNQMQQIQIFDFGVLNDLSIELSNQNIDYNRVEGLLRMILARFEDPYDAQDSAIPRIKQSPLFLQIVNLIGLTNSNKIIELCYDILIFVTAQCDCSDVIEDVCDVLLLRSRSGQLIDPATNHGWFLTKRNTGNDEYTRCVIECDIETSDEVDIRSSAVLLLQNLVAEATPSIVKRVLQKSMLFPILRQNVVMENLKSHSLDYIVALISNLARVPQFYNFIDFAELPNLLQVLLPRVIQRGGVSLTSLLNAIKLVLESGDEDNVNDFVNDSYQIVDMLNQFLINDDGNRRDDAKNYEESLECTVEILQICCAQFDRLTLQMVKLGIFDGLSRVVLLGRTNKLIVLALRVFATSFSMQNTLILDGVAFDKNFNQDNMLIRRFLELADQNQDQSIKDAAANCLSQFVGSAHEIHFTEVYEDQLMRVLLNVLKSEGTTPDTLQAIIVALANLIFVGNLGNTVENNPYTKAFLANSGETVLDQIQDRLPDNAYYDSERLMNFILNGNGNYGEDEEDDVFEVHNQS